LASRLLKHFFLRCFSKHKGVKTAIEAIWAVVPKEQNRISKVDYMKIFMRICKMLNRNMDYEEALETVQADYEKDSKGKDGLDSNDFFTAMFELVDHWTLDIDAEEYIEFLTTLLVRLQA
jgi:hypothetical protein